MVMVGFPDDDALERQIRAAKTINDFPDWSIEGYRVNIENWGIPRGATVADVVRFEIEELGNERHLSEEQLKMLEKYPAHNAIWIAKSKEAASEYLSAGMTEADISHYKAGGFGPGSKIIDLDFQEGYLVLMGSAILPHRGIDPEAIKVAEKFGLLFDGMMDRYYQFTTSDKYSPEFRGITFVVDDLTKIEGRLKVKLIEFGGGKDLIPATVIRTDPRWDSMVRHLGYEPVTLDKTTAAKMPTDIQLIRDSQERLAKVAVLPAGSLNERQKTHLELSRAIAAHLHMHPVSSIEAARIPPASPRVRTAGLYSQSLRRIYISSEQLESGRRTVDTTVHELAHHGSKAEDGERAHNEAMTRVAASVVKNTAQGRYDNILRHPEFRW